MTDVKRTCIYPCAAEQLWAIVGSFDSLADWHPAIATCELSEDGGQRKLTLEGGGKILEGLLKHDDNNMAYEYEILESPLPISGYKARIAVTDENNGCRLTWSSRFDTDLSDNEADEIIGGIYEAGFDALKGRVG